MLDKRPWEEFRESGLLWLINTLLHTFGWTIVIEIDQDTNSITSVYPARTKYRGFNQQSNDIGYKKVTKYLSDNIDDLINEVADIPDEIMKGE